MDDPWADTPSTPIGGTPRISLEVPVSPVRTSPEPESEFEFEDQAQVTADESQVDQPTTTIAGTEDEFDDFDDFDAPEAGPSSLSIGTGGGEDDGFGDFGDFEEGDFGEGGGVSAEPEQVQVQPAFEAGVDRWSALNLRPFPTRSELVDQLSDILNPLIPRPDILPNDPIRSVGGLSQIMSAESSREVYAQLTTPPILKPLDWTRSRVRREHLISMGVPVNLDEVDSHRISALPPLRITTLQGQGQGSSSQAQARRASSLEVNDPSRNKGKGREDEAPRSAGAATSNGERGKYGLGTQPDLDISKAEELCGLEEDRLSILPLSTLQGIQDQLVTTSAQASATLAWSLQLKDAQNHDSATYNGMISELISNAAKAKSAQQTGSGGVFRRSSQKVPVKQNSMSGNSTPRIGSPAMR